MTEENVLITTEEQHTRLGIERERVAQTLEDLRQEIETLHQKVRNGEDVKTTDANKVITETRYWLKALRETETEIETIRRRNAGISGSYGLDLDQARDLIGCRMALLRPCCRSE